MTPDPVRFLEPSSSFREQRRFEEWARSLIRLPRPGEDPLAYLLPEATWQSLLSRAPEPETWLAALSRATGVYFFPSREWPLRFLSWLKRLRLTRLLEAGAGRGYLSAGLAPLAAAAKVAFWAIDKNEGEYAPLLPRHETVARGDVFQAVFELRPEVVFYGWPPPGQQLAPLFACPGLKYLVVAGEAGGGVTGAREDWELLPSRKSPFLSRFCRGRTAPERHQVTVFQPPGGPRDNVKGKTPGAPGQEAA